MRLYPHQKEALTNTVGYKNVAYYLDMGLGKTFVGSERMNLYGKRINLIICQKSKVQDWCKHMYDHYGNQYLIFDLTKKGEYADFFNGYEYERVGVINYDLCWRRKDLLKLQDFTLMLDESSLIQNKNAKMTDFILKLKPSHVILLSGTPCSGKYENLWTQAKLLGWDIDEEVFLKHYVNWVTVENGGFFHKVVNMDDPYKNVERLKRKLREHGAVFLKTDEVFDLPDQTFTVVNIPELKAYKQFVKKSYVQIGDTEFIGDSTLKKKLCERQLCGYYNPAKAEVLKELLQSTHDRVIVFYTFIKDLEVIKQVCDELGRPTSEINGSVKDLTAYEQYDNSVTAVQWQSGSMGLNLQKSNKIIYFDLTDRSDFFEQSKKRIHRIGQNRPCFYYLLLCGIEYDMYEVLEQKRDYTDELFAMRERERRNGKRISSV